MTSSVTSTSRRRRVSMHGGVAAPSAPTLTRALPPPPQQRNPGGPLLLVEMVTSTGDVVQVGSARKALHDARLNGAERRVVRNVLAAVNALGSHALLNGADDAGNAVRLLLRSDQATIDGPFAEPGRISVGRNNPFTGSGMRARAGVLLPVDAAIHELTHVVQFARLGAAAKQLQPALAEGIADAVSMLATRDFSTGEGFFERRGGRPTHAVRSISEGRARVPGEPVQTDYRNVRSGRVEVHEAGGVVSRTFQELQRHLGWERAEQLLWAVIRDSQAWQGGGSWAQLAEGIVRCSGGLWPGDATIGAAVAAALRTTHLDEAPADAA